MRLEDGSSGSDDVANDEDDVDEEGEESYVEHHKKKIVALVKTFICDTTGQDPFENQEFSFHDFMAYLKEKAGRSPRKGGMEYMRELIEKSNDAFLLNGDTVCLLKISPTEAEPLDSTIWKIVEDFILETTLKKPYDMQHFCLSDLQNWFAIKANMVDEERLRASMFLAEAIDNNPDLFSREEDNCWIECCSEDLAESPKAMLNGDNGCFGVSAFLFLCAIQADQHLDPNAERSLNQQHLHDKLIQMCTAYRDPHVPPFGPEPLINAANACLPVNSRPDDRFVGGNQACAMEFLARNPGGLLHNIFLEPGFLVTYLQQGLCDQCGQVYQQPLPAPVLDIALPVLPATAAPVDLHPLFLAALANPTTLTDLTCARQCSGTREIQCSLVEQPGMVLILNLGRYNGAVRQMFFTAFYH